MSSELIKTKVIGPVIIITAPSGSGKTTLVKYLLSQFPSLNFSISATTRTKRPMEEDGKDYHFVTTDKFLSFREQGLLVEWEEVYPNQFYGTLYSELTKIWERGNIVLFDVDESYDELLIKHEIPVFLALKKAAFYPNKLNENEVLLTADTIVWINNHVLNKPENEQEAFEMLSEICGTTHEVFTGVCIKSNN